jgi:DNA repair exonuclease SbcCD ATPase subunit
MLALVDMTRSLSDQISGMKEQTNSAASELEEAKTQIRKLTEERELLRATLTQAGASGKATVKIVRPVSAPRARAAAPLADRPNSARAIGACQGCEVLEVRIRETHLLLKEAEEKNTELAANIEALNEEKMQWQRRAPANKKPDSPPTAPASAPAAAPPAASNDSAKEIAALKKKVSDLEKQLAGKTKEAKEAKESAEAAKSKADKLAKENKEKDAKIKDLEKLLAEALAKVSTLEKRLNDVSLNLKATGESSDGALL